MKYRDFPQRYLFETDCSCVSDRLTILTVSRLEYDEVQEYKVSRNLFDYNSPSRRFITVETLDKIARTLEEFNVISRQVAWVDELLIVDTYTLTDNPIINKYSDTRVMGYVRQFKRSGVKKITVVRMTD